ncbi:MAG: hypothetical protein FJ050_12590 [Cyanobacteria bacterium M_surface_7_m2_040]|nr:hypothetical protein [Cyanobacteria bacterium M_surface_7_m2_040]
MTDPQTAANGLGALLGELAAFGLAIGFSPLHIGLLLLLLRGAAIFAGAIVLMIVGFVLRES